MGCVASLDFETFSEAGYVWDEARQRWRGLAPSKSGIQAVGAAVYAEHPTTEVLCVAYDLGEGVKFWVPGGVPEAVLRQLVIGDQLRLLELCGKSPAPIDLLQHVVDGGLLQAFNSSFEFLIWDRVCRTRYGWPGLRLDQMRCSQAKAKAFGLPATLEGGAKVLGLDMQKGLGT